MYDVTGQVLSRDPRAPLRFVNHATLRHPPAALWDPTTVIEFHFRMVTFVVSLHRDRATPSNIHEQYCYQSAEVCRSHPYVPTFS